MKRSKSGHSGFTLIELMVVMAIMSILFSLIGPLVQQQVDKVKASEEWYSFTQQSRQIAALAFFQGKTYSLKLKGNQLQLYVNAELVQQQQFEQLIFNEQQVQFNANGYPDKATITAQVRQATKTLSLVAQQEKILGLQ